MNLALSPDQMAFQHGVARFLAERHDHAAGWTGGACASAWAGLVALGVPGACLPERFGGLGYGPVEAMVICQELGRVVSVEPYLATCVLGAGVLGAGVLQTAGLAALQDAILPGVADGSVHLALAYAEPQGRFDPDDVAATARRVPGGWRLDGVKALALNAGRAAHLIVSARTAGSRRERAGLSLFLLPQDAPGLALRRFRTQDGLDAADLMLDGVMVPDALLLGQADQGLAVVEAVLEQANAAVCAMALGAMEEGLAMTIDYLRLRQQFGRALADFQALQHRLVELHMIVEETRSLVLAATAAMVDADPQERHQAVTAAKIHTGQAALQVGQECIQLHGGIGITAEHRIGRIAKRLLACATLFGDAAWHTARYDLATAEET